MFSLSPSYIGKQHFTMLIIRPGARYINMTSDMNSPFLKLRTLSLRDVKELLYGQRTDKEQSLNLIPDVSQVQSFFSSLYLLKHFFALANLTGAGNRVSF